MAQLRQEAPLLATLDVEIIVVGPEKPASFNKYFEKAKLPFIGLPDPEHSVSKLYGQEIKILKLGRMPAQILIDKQGMVQFAYYGDSMADIPTVAHIKKILSS